MCQNETLRLSLCTALGEAEGLKYSTNHMEKKMDAAIKESKQWKRNAGSWFAEASRLRCHSCELSKEIEQLRGGHAQPQVAVCSFCSLGLDNDLAEEWNGGDEPSHRPYIPKTGFTHKLPAPDHRFS